MMFLLVFDIFYQSVFFLNRIGECTIPILPAVEGGEESVVLDEIRSGELNVFK